MNTSHARTGRLFLIGGAADSCMSHFVDLAGGPDIHIAVLSHASGIPRQVADEHKRKFADLGVKNVTTITPRSRQELPASIGAIYMTGGDQVRLVRMLHRGGLLPQLLQASERGVLIAGTSAGAAAVAPEMVAGGMADGVLQADSLKLAKGLALLPGVIVDTHFVQRNRFNRMRAAIATLSDTVAVGLDEDTGIFVTHRNCTVYGQGQAHLFRRHAEKSGSTSEGWMSIASGATIESFASGATFAL
jgi:cyanophycinase